MYNLTIKTITKTRFLRLICSWQETARVKEGTAVVVVLRRHEVTTIKLESGCDHSSVSLGSKNCKPSCGETTLG